VGQDAILRGGCQPPPTDRRLIARLIGNQSRLGKLPHNLRSFVTQEY